MWDSEGGGKIGGHPLWVRGKEKIWVLLRRLGWEFEEECQERGVRLYVVRPRSPEEQGHVERAQGIHRYEFYESYDLPLDLRELRQVVGSGSGSATS